MKTLFPISVPLFGLLCGLLTVPAHGSAKFMLRSPVVDDGGILSADFTGDGGGATLPLEWDGTPEGTASFAVIMHHIDPEGKTKWYWVLYNIPPDVRSLPKNTSGTGVLGNNSINGRTEYAPPHSKGPGEKTYIYTVYALSAPPEPGVEPSEVSRDVLLAAIKDTVIASAELKVVYTRPGDREPRDEPLVPGFE
jgi:Raf kinase inhibitor-like YbhB/YbcL family protein